MGSSSVRDEFLRQLITIAASAVAALASAVIFLLAYDATLDRAQGRTDSATSAFVSKLKSIPVILMTPNGGETERELYFEINGNEILVDLRGLCVPESVRQLSDKLLVSCSGGKSLELPISCVPTNWGYNNGVLVVVCKEQPKVESGEGQ